MKDTDLCIKFTILERCLHYLMITLPFPFVQVCDHKATKYVLSIVVTNTEKKKHDCVPIHIKVVMGVGRVETSY